ncbi:MAG: YggS family pyridoxal phosphate-dependent enzyme, partial [Gemmatimonadota bacterium]
MPDVSFAQRLQRVRSRVREAADRAGRDPGEVEILPVTKGHPPSTIRAVADADLAAVAENRVGEAEEKLAENGRLGLSWHMVGHLQRNKASRAVEAFDVIESVDSRLLARKLARE